VFRANAVERRQGERRRPVFEKWVFAHSTSSVGFPRS
jgi:hypothetical protein